MEDFQSKPRGNREPPEQPPGEMFPDWSLGPKLAVDPYLDAALKRIADPQQPARAVQDRLAAYDNERPRNSRRAMTADEVAVGKLPITDPGYWAQSGTESGHQKSLFAWAAIEAKTDPRLSLMFAIPNGGKRDAGTAARMKAEGVRAGVPDIFLPAPVVRINHGDNSALWHGLFIEMKVGKGKLSDEQKEWMFAFDQQGYKCETCYSWLEAREAINNYLGR